jgi:hypothetical protein
LDRNQDGNSDEQRSKLIAQSKNTFEKRKREMDKKAKAVEKRARKAARKNGNDAEISLGPFGIQRPAKPPEATK